MRNITAKAVAAFTNGYTMREGNTSVSRTPTGAELRLHGHLIAERLNGRLFIDSCGYMTNTTKERLNALPGVSINQKSFEWFLNGAKWDGQRTEVI